MKENRVDSFEDDKSGPDKEPLGEYAQKAQRMLDANKNFFAYFAKDVSLRFKIGTGYFFDHEKGEVNLDARWFAEKNCSEEQIIWGVLHELGHFRDMATDAEGYVSLHDHTLKMSRKTGALILKKWEEAVGVSDPEFIERMKKARPIRKEKPDETVNGAEASAYKIHHTFYNVLDDAFFVNQIVERKLVKYDRNEKGGREVERLYREKLFPKKDFTDSPRHLQFLYKLLREEMVPDEEVEVSDDVKEALSRKIVYRGKEYTTKEIVELLLKPGKGRESEAGKRYLLLQKTLEPIYEQLLAKDLEDWQPKPPDTPPPPPPGGEGEGPRGGDPEDGRGDPFKDDYDEYDKNTPDQVDDKDMRDWTRESETRKKEKEKKDQKEIEKGAEERAKEMEKEADRKWREEQGVTKETLDQFQIIEKKVAPYLAELSRLWRQIIFGSARELQKELEGYYKTGEELDVEKVVVEFPKIVKGDTEEVKVMKRMVEKESLVKRPELIRVRLVGDLSGSMDSSKLKVLKECFVLILSSLQEFNIYLNLEKARTGSKLRVDSEARVFASPWHEKVIKPFGEGKHYGSERASIVKVFEGLQVKEDGSTFDHVPLEKIFASLGNEEMRRISQKKIMEIVIEVTDGGSSDASATRAAVDELLKVGVIVRALQIGMVGKGEKKLFDKVWNDDRDEALGEVVGEKIEKLLPAVTALLKKYLSTVRL